ncbi:c-type cytochrome domain-containing protein [Rosistilla oblonga]|uniref:c-type cytochrome domain-containing protein n=1 Tax=Rosistilla oblonga TaxID=2527990 RepID=UPI001E403B0C|nr:c-type cytochrome domain-containing protein [Rosistilla oblonga]
MKLLMGLLMNKVNLLICVEMLCVLLASQSVSSGDAGDQAYKLLKENCHRCHGVEFKHDRLNVLDRDVLVAKPVTDPDEDPYVTPGAPDASRLWRAIVDDHMPPEEPLSDEDKATIKQWIETGAEWTLSTERSFVSEYEVLQAISSDLFQVRRQERKFQRYFSLTHIHNNRKVPDEDLQIYKAALSKALNSMSRQSAIALPRSINDSDTVFCIDLRDYGWQEFGVWDELLELYPYGLKPGTVDGLEQYEKIEELFGADGFDGVTHFRADWFVTHATRPPLYHKLADIPATEQELLKRVNVDVQQSFKLGISRRAGLFQSGVSAQNRLIEYHSSQNGTFWLSYDFQRNSPRSNLARFPLGPKFEGNPFDSVAFEHAGGEIIWNLPNGLHAYMLVDAKGERIDRGPIDIVWDSKNVAGTPEIVNGISCISCHRHGMIPIDDFVRSGNALESAEARRKVQELYATPADLLAALNDSKVAYLSKLKAAVGTYLQVGKNKDRPIEEFEEPISRVARLYDRNLDLEAAARELGYESITDLKNQVFSGGLFSLGLGPLAIEGGTVKRAEWESREATVSVFQQAASELRIGSPFNN